jgi:hypothetical protein
MNGTNHPGAAPRIGAWFAAPFTQPISIPDFMLLVALGVTVAIFWSRILAHITEAE